VRMDHKQLPWAWTFAVLAVTATVIFVVDGVGRERPHYGSSAVGIVFGVIAALIMLAAAALRVRRARPRWRIGRSQTWLRFHIWGGLLAALLAFLHSGFQLGGALTSVLTLLVVLVTLSGIVGIAIQHWTPPLLTAEVPRESVAQQTGRELEQLPLRLESIVRACVDEVAAATPALRANRTVLILASADGQLIDADEVRLKRDVDTLERFALTRVMPFLQGNPSAPDPLAELRPAFARLREELVAHTRQAVAAIEQLCNQRRWLVRQRWWSRIMLGWLVIHVPLSYALIALMLLHAIVASRFIGS